MTESGYRPAAICRRGHVASTDIDLSPELASHRCGTCGAQILRACPSCTRPIRGRYYVPGFIGIGEEYTPPDFCEDCGEPFPWLSRQGRIFLLQNILDEADLGPAERLRASEQLEALTDPDLDDEEQARLWARFRKAVPTVWAADTAQKVIATVVDASTRAMIDKYG